MRSHDTELIEAVSDHLGGLDCGSLLPLADLKRPSGRGLPESKLPARRPWLPATPLWLGLMLLASTFNLAWGQTSSVAPTRASDLPATNFPVSKPARLPVSARDFFNAGTRRLEAGKLNEAETFLQRALSWQDTGLQPPALYNLGHVRFAQGTEELKKSLAAGPTARRGRTATVLAEQAARQAADALASGEMQRMVAAYQRGRGARRELREATKAIQRALELHGAALRRWQRALGDFRSAVELNPADTNAQHNAEVVERSIARLVDSIQEMQQVMMGMGQPKQELEQRMKQLKGMIPEPLMPPGAAGEEEEEEDGRSREPKPGEMEGPQRDGQEMSLSPEEAGWLLEGFRLDGERRLPMGQGETGEPRDRKGRNW